MTTALEQPYDATVIDCIIANLHDKTILIQQRSGTRKAFPYCWDFIGGHLEEGETVEQSISRELREESSMELVKIITKLHEFSWSCDHKVVNDIVYLIEASGDFRLEDGKAIDFKWIRRDEIHLLLKSGEQTNGLYEAAGKAFDWMEQNQSLTRKREFKALKIQTKGFKFDRDELYDD